MHARPARFTPRISRRDATFSSSIRIPADRDFWQSAKGPYAGTMAVKDGGSMICVAPNPEGVASNHENVLKIGYRPHAELVAMVQQGKVDDLVGAAILADVCQIVDKTDCIMVSPGVKPEEAKKIGFRSAATAQEGFRWRSRNRARLRRSRCSDSAGMCFPSLMMNQPSELPVKPNCRIRADLTASIIPIDV